MDCSGKDDTYASGSPALHLLTAFTLLHDVGGHRERMVTLKNASAPSSRELCDSAGAAESKTLLLTPATL